MGDETHRKFKKEMADGERKWVRAVKQLERHGKRLAERDEMQRRYEQQMEEEKFSRVQETTAQGDLCRAVGGRKSDWRLSKIVQETTEETETYVGDLEEDNNRVAGREQCWETCDKHSGDKKEQLADVENCVK